MATKKTARRTDKKPARTRSTKPKKRAAAPKKSTPPRPRSTRPPRAETSFQRLELLLQAHPGLVLDGQERENFARECPDLEALIAENRADSELLFRCAWAYRKMGRFEEALRVADLALLASRSWRTVTAKATVYRAMNDVDNAIELFEEAAQLDRNDTAALMEGARTLGETGRFVDAALWFGRVLERNPGHAEARLWYEYSLFLATGAEEHVQRVRAFAEEHPDDELARRILADMQRP